MVYIFVTFITNLQVRSWWMIVYPIYALTQSLVMPLLGAGYYVVLACRKGRLGRYRFSYRRGTPPATLERLRLERIQRIALAVATARGRA